MTGELTAKSVEVALHEFDYVTGLIRMYRSLQLQAVGLSLTAYAAVLALVGAALGSTDLALVASPTTLLLPFFAILVILGFGTMELRIRRASLYVSNDLKPLIHRLTGDTGLLQYEDNPSKYLSRWERGLSNSTVFILIIAVPALLAGVWHSYFAPRLLANASTFPAFAAIGCVLLLLTTYSVSQGSAHHEGRKDQIKKDLTVSEAGGAPPSPAA